VVTVHGQSSVDFGVTLEGLRSARQHGHPIRL